MKKIRLLISFSFILLFEVFLLQAKTSEKSIPVVPLPREVTLDNGEFDLTKLSASFFMYGLERDTRLIIDKQLVKEFTANYGIQLMANTKAKNEIRIGVYNSDPVFDEIARKNDLIPDRELGKEGYLLKIDKKDIIIVANHTAGAFYGVQTLKQLLRGYVKMNSIPAMTIRDLPSIDFRCVMDDISRGPVPTHEYIKYQIRRYAELKINAMSFYIEHIVKTEKYPDFAPGNGNISIEEFKELSEYAKPYNIELVGNFQSLGHFEKILSHPQYRHLGATDRMLDPLNPEGIEFLNNIYSEMAPAFSSDFFTPNCDEAWDLSRGKLSGAGDSLTVAEIYANHVMSIDSSLQKLGKNTIIWGDIILSHPEILDIIPKNIIVGAWNYSPNESFAEFIDPVRNAGFKFTVSPGVLNSNRLIPDFRMATTNIRNFINEGYQKGTTGVYCTVWDDGGMHFFSRDWYGIAYNAEQSWQPNFNSLDEFDIRFSKGLYGDHENLIPHSLHALNNLTDLEPTFEMNSNVFWKQLVPERGDKISFNPDNWTEVKKWAEKSLRILEGKELRHYNDESDFIIFTCKQYIFMADARMELIRAAELYNIASELQLTNREKTLLHLNQARELLIELKDRFFHLTEDFKRLWDMENRPYWLDRGLINYHTRNQAFQNQVELLDQAIEKFEKGIYLPPPAEVRLDIRPRTGQYFQYWLMTGSFPLKSFEESSKDFLQSIGGEADARPFPGMRFKDEQGIERSWIKYDSPTSREIDFQKIFEPKVTAVAYAYCTIDSPSKQRITGLLGSNDGATVYLNGEKVHYVHIKRSLIPDEDEIVLDLEEGRNHLMIKVEQWKGGWGLSFRLKDVEIRNHKQKYYIQ